MLAVLNHNVKNKAVNDSKEIAVIVYFTTLTVLENLILGIVVAHNHTTKILNVALILMATTVIIGVTFIPKVNNFPMQKLIIVSYPSNYML